MPRSPSPRTCPPRSSARSHRPPGGQASGPRSGRSTCGTCGADLLAAAPSAGRARRCGSGAASAARRPLLHRAVLGYASDYTLLESVLRRHGVTWATPGLKAASLDHAMWWHRPVRVDEWLLYVQASPSAQWCTRPRDWAYLQPGRAPGRLGRAGGDAARPAGSARSGRSLSTNFRRTCGVAHGC